MVSEAKGRARACLLAAAASGLALSAPARAQQTPADPAELDPNAPLDPMPDLGIDWPDMNQPDPVPEPEPLPEEETTETAQQPAVAIDDPAFERDLSAFAERAGELRFEYLRLLVHRPPA